MNIYIVRIQWLNTQTLQWVQCMSARVKPADQEELDRVSDEILNAWLQENPNRPASYVQSVWRAAYKD